MEDDLYGDISEAAIAEGPVDVTLYEGLFAGPSSSGHHETYLQNKINELEELLRERKLEVQALRSQLQERDQQLLNVTTERDILMRNISCLFKTAKEEMTRKQAEINSLRAEVAVAKQQQQQPRPQQRSPQLPIPSLCMDAEVVHPIRPSAPGVAAGSKRGRDTDVKADAGAANGNSRRCGADGAKRDMGVATTGTNSTSFCDNRISDQGALKDPDYSDHRIREDGSDCYEEGCRAGFRGAGELQRRARESDRGRLERAGSSCRAGKPGHERDRGDSDDEDQERPRQRHGQGNAHAREPPGRERSGGVDGRHDYDRQHRGVRAEPSDKRAREVYDGEGSCGAGLRRSRDAEGQRERDSSIDGRGRDLRGKERPGGEDTKRYRDRDAHHQRDPTSAWRAGELRGHERSREGDGRRDRDLQRSREGLSEQKEGRTIRDGDREGRHQHSNRDYRKAERF
ncbi:hypothetical protein VOLCADRAFT_117560 [Volvox carteri f. nagariensis]|uniref:Uncharacterized protein n=1 Tax=Volvox carteri f. nagariensis TaxID=3068 RepID=D8TV58_VOLCA|nr:uncharacterized protein VOLCADRAFT_117560 [Volvox carteri f. nagariensis]EFJ48645.1 hypothetical protein VOLCADRAFT_117560 [Volvox carteri f. nagariensis]|eukprot:XP_002950444.1 hypothetical protein VOLCADRAFT_117560 [Volvox carteri f. nagariensis]